MTIDELNANKAGQDKNNNNLGGGGLFGGGSLAVNQNQIPKASSGRFTNIQNIISANQGAGQRLAQATTGNVSRTVNQAGQEVSKFGSEIGSKIAEEKSRINTGKDEIASIIQAAKAPTSGPGTFASLDDPNKFSQLRQVVTGQTNIADINQQLQNRFSGASTALTQAQQEANQLANERGRFNLLRKVITNPIYSRGMSTLDNVLMSTEGGKTLNQGLQASTANILARGQQLNTQVDEFGNELKTTGQLASNVSRELMDQLAEGDKAIEKEIRDYEQYADSQRKLVSDALNAFRSEQFSKLTPEQVSLLNIPYIKANLFDLDLNKYINDPRALTGIQAGEFVTEEQAARANALRRLMQGENANLLQKGNTKLEDVLGKIDFNQLQKDSEKRKMDILKEIYYNYVGGRVAPQNREQAFINWLNSGSILQLEGSSYKGDARTDAWARANLNKYIVDGDFAPHAMVYATHRDWKNDAASDDEARAAAISNLRRLFDQYNSQYNFKRKFIHSTNPLISSVRTNNLRLW
jgi:hypothetical protein